MRIIAGTARRVQLEVADESTTRPFLEMARGALFNSLGGLVIGQAVLDCYAGSGALGLEALSRGAESCLFVEMDPRAARALRNNIQRAGMAERSRVVRSDVAVALSAEAGPFGLIFVDPPFGELGEWRVEGRAGMVMQRISKLLSLDGTVIFRLEDKKYSPPEWPGLRLDLDRRYGRSRVCRYVRDDARPADDGEA